MILFNNLAIIFFTINEFVNYNSWIFLIGEIIVLVTIVSLASRTTDKILRGLQGTAATTIISRGIHDAYKSWKDNGSRGNSNDSGNKDTDKVKNQENKPKPVPTVTRINEK
jgi:uncharacterized membrane protein